MPSQGHITPGQQTGQGQGLSFMQGQGQGQQTSQGQGPSFMRGQIPGHQTSQGSFMQGQGQIITGQPTSQGQGLSFMPSQGQTIPGQQTSQGHFQGSMMGQGVFQTGLGPMGFGQGSWASAQAIPYDTPLGQLLPQARSSRAGMQAMPKMGKQQWPGPHGGVRNQKPKMFSTKCMVIGQIATEDKVHLLEMVQPVAWNAISAWAHTYADIDAAFVVGFERWPGSPIEIRSVSISVSAHDV
jgi:hypothetical protein